MTCNACKWLIALSLVAACVLSAPAAIAQQDVLVVNGNRRPVPTTNRIDSQGNPSPLAVLEETQPYEDSCQIFMQGSSGGACYFRTIPAGKRLVVEEFDGYGLLSTGIKPVLIRFDASTNHAFPTTFMGTLNAEDYYATHQQTRLYVSSGTNASCYVSLSGTSSSGDFNCALSGFLVDVP
jgi:hypothetical protein